MSFTDGTTVNFSPDQRRPVAIEGTVPRNADLKWYYTLLQRYTHVSGELKSEVILVDFHTQPTNIQRDVWGGMKHVMIHIADSLPHKNAIVSIIETRTKKGWYDALKKRADAKDKPSIELLRWADKFVDNYVSDRLQNESSASRFLTLVPYLEAPYSLRHYMRDSDTGWKPGIDYTPAIDPQSNLVCS